MGDLNEYQIVKVGDLPIAQTLDGLNILGFDSTNNRAVRALMTLLKGLDGKPVELQKSATHMQWRVQGGTWANLLTLDEIKGAKGDPNTLSIGTVKGGANAGATITGTSPNQTLNLTLPKGDTGSNIELQRNTTHVQWRVVGGTWANLIPLADLKGDKGDNISLQKTTTHIQWRLGTGTWANLVALTELKGDTGANIELQKSATHVQWRVAGTSTWNNLIPIDDLKVKGDTGANIELQKSSTHVQWRVVGSPTWINLIPLADLKGDKGDAGENAVMEIGDIVTVPSDSQADASVEYVGEDSEGRPIYKLNLWLPKGVDGEGAGDMLKSVYDPTGKNADVFGYVDGKVKTDVPVNAKFTDTTYENATTSVSGLMSDTDKSKLDGVEAGANKYVHPAGTNPHGTTKSDVGLGNVDNVKQASKTEFDTHDSDTTRHITSAERTAWNAKGSSNLALGETSATAYRGDRGKIAYDHSQTAHAPANAQKNSDITKAEIEAKLTGVITTHSHTVTKANVGLGNVDNVKQIPFSEKGANNGVAELDSTGKVLSSQLPSYVDDVLEYTTLANFPTTGETGKIYIAINTNLTYRWTGTAYTEISPSIALGETSATAYRGDKGKIAYDHSQVAHAPSTAQKNSDITKAEIEAKLTGAITTHTHSQYIESSKFQVVESLPASPVSGTFYFVKE